ncbi:hypothetical protein GX48_07425 [Paracoccidioides brasiliensis]|nr:hypothetical protein GX48_07425 [Paracoccidioides brasiliensis]
MEMGLQNEKRRSRREGEDVSSKSYYIVNDSNGNPKKNPGGFHQDSHSPRGNHSPSLMNESFPRVPSPTSDEHHPSSHSLITGTYDKIMFIPAHMMLPPEEASLLRRARQFPPVTACSLGELSLESIIKNTQLRMDVNFDKDLHFRPVGGPAKLKVADEYWRAIAIEFSIYAFCTSHSINFSLDLDSSLPIHQVFQARLPKMLDILREILLTLVPERDCQCVEENLDISFLMKQIEKGVLNLVGLAEWLATLLKTHCAPMRDHMADEMVKHIQTGCQLQDMNEIAEGLKQLFAILESMKLDVANHQIRAFRVLLIQDSIEYLTKYFHFSMKKSPRTFREAQDARDWYLGYRRLERYQNNPQLVLNNFESAKVLFEGLFSILCSFGSPKLFPKTFQFDIDRLCNIQDNFETLVLLQVCYQVFNAAVRRIYGEISFCTSTYNSLQSRILSVLKYGDYQSVETRPPGNCTIDRFRGNIPNIALEIARVAHMMQDSHCGATYPDESTIDFASSMLRSLLWFKDAQFWDIRDCIQQDLQSITIEFAEQFWSMTALGVADSQNLGRSYDHMSLPQIPDLQCLGKRLAHIGLLHWRVWAPLIYSPEDGV